MKPKQSCCDFCRYKIYNSKTRDFETDCLDVKCKCHSVKQSMEWRENLHKMVLSVMYPKKDSKGNFLSKLPPVIIDAIDAAFIAGMDTRKPELLRIKKEIESELEKRQFEPPYTEGINYALGVMARIFKK